MRLIAALSWYRERPDWLTELVTSLHRAGVTHLVCVDGPYALYPDKRPTSSVEEYDALETAGLAHGISLITHTPYAPWAGNEIEKRNALFALAHAIARPGQDWLLVIDGDETLDATDLPAQLADTDLDTATLTHTEPRVRTARERRLYRAQASGINVVGAHYRYHAGDGTVLWDGSKPSTQVEAHWLTGAQIIHRPRHREPERRQGRARYYEERLLTHAEA